MNADERGRARYRLDRRIRPVWTAAGEERFVRLALAAFPGSYEVDKDGEPVPPEQLTLDEAA